jgi:polar amino acid transport system permease protein
MEPQGAFDLAFAWQILPQLLQGLWVTVQVTLLGYAAALVIGLLFAVGRRSRIPVLATAAAWLVEFLRSTPLLLQLYFLFYVLPEMGLSLSPLMAGLVGLSLHYGAYTSEVYRAGLEAVPRGQWEAATALNLSPGQTFRHVILPQALPPIVPVLGNRFVAMFKDTPLLSAITVVELLQQAKLVGAETFRYMEALTLVGLLFLIVSVVSSAGISWLERRTALPTA